MKELPSGPVTMLFTDIEGSTSLWNEHEAEMRQAHSLHNTLLISVFEENGGLILKDKGDGFIVVFSNPMAALDSALQSQRALRSASWPSERLALKVRMAINTGIIEPRDGDYYGPQVNKTARLEALAHGGQVLVSESTRALVADQLGSETQLLDLGRQSLKGFTQPEKIYQITTEDLPSDFPPLLGHKRGRGLPSFASSFVGREDSKQEILGLIRNGTRLVTLLGPGGIGKTRLAVETAREVEPILTGGAYFADLAPLGSPDQVGTTVAESMGVHAEGSADVLSLVADTVTRPTLLVVDNFEHVAEASSAIGSLLTNTPQLSVIATSRQPLALRDEKIYRLDPLDLSSNGSPSPAVELFYERAAAQGVHLTEDDRPAVASICARLDGLPLAIELVAPRARLVSVGELDAMLERSLDALGSGPADLPERHRTIRNAIDWSLQGLQESQRTLFARLAALPAGGTLEMIESVCSPGLDGPLLDNMATLVDNSLVNSDTSPAGGTRFRQLAPLREYGLEMLAHMGDYGATMNRLVDLYVGRAPAMGRRLQRDESADREVTVDRANLLAAMEWSLTAGRAAEMASVTMDMWVYWFRGDRIQDAVSWVSRAKTVVDTPEIRWLAGFFAFQTGDFEQVDASMEAAAVGFSERGDTHGEALALTFNALATNDPGRSYRMIDNALDRLEDPVERAITLLFKSIIDFMVGDFDSSMRRREEVLSLFVDLEMAELIAWLHWNLALSYYGTGRYPEAADYFGRSFSYMAEERYQEGVASVSVGIGLCEIQAGRVERGVNLIGAGDVTFDRLGTVQWFEAQAHTDASAARLVEELGQESYDRYYEAGRQLSFTEMIELAEDALADLTGF